MERELSDILDSKLGKRLVDWKTTNDSVKLEFEDESVLVIKGAADFRDEEEGLVICEERVVQTGPYRVTSNGIPKKDIYKD